MAKPFACQIQNLSVQYRSRSGPVTALDGVSCSLAAGEITGLTGESGSGKSTLGAVLLNHLPEAAKVTGGTVEWTPSRPRAAWIPQEPQAALNPVLAVWRQVAEAIRLPHPDVNDRSRRAAETLLAAAGCRDAPSVAAAFPHQLSGGLCQRVLIATALAQDAQLVIADEATESLDPSTQAGICRQLRRLARERGAALLFISHDLPLVAEVAAKVLVLENGRVVEAGPVETVFSTPQHPHTRQLLASLPVAPALPAQAVQVRAGREAVREAAAALEPAARLTNVSVRFQRQGTEIRALAGIDLTVAPGEFYGLIGESGAGKSTLARCMTGLLEPDSGSVVTAGWRSPAALPPAQEQAFRRRCRYLPQPARASLNPRLTVLEHLLEAFRAVDGPENRPVWAVWRPRTFRPRVRSALRLLVAAGLEPPLARRYPHQLSGGQARRVGFALAMASQPDLIVADEPFSGLDLPASVSLVRWLKEVVAGGCALVIVSHRLDLVAGAVHRIGVLHDGQLVEEGPAAELWHHPQAPATRTILEALPSAIKRAAQGS